MAAKAPRSLAEPKQQPAARLKRSSWSPMAVVDQLFFIVASLASFWLAWLVWREGWHSGGWWLVGLFVIVWVITAYLALPRAHRILSSLYVPNYFIGRTRTADGLLGDPVNVALRGSEAQLHKAMQAAGWTLADEITPRSTWGMIRSTLLRRSYPAAPVSSLFLFGRRQDFAYQQEVDGNPGKRHHVRFWRCPDGWLLPGGHKVDWLAAGTYDKSVGLSLFTLQVTHKIDENTDIERDYIVQTVLENASEGVDVTILKDFSTGYHSRNGGGDSIQTDGDLPVLELGRVQANTTLSEPTGIIMDSTAYELLPSSHDTVLEQLWSKRPVHIVLGVFLVFLALVTAAISTGIELIDISYIREQVATQIQVEQQAAPVEMIDLTVNSMLIGSIVITVIWTVVTIILAHFVLAGGNRSRIWLMIAAALAIAISASTLTVGRITWSATGTLAFIGLNICIILLLSADASRRFTRHRSR